MIFQKWEAVGKKTATVFGQFPEKEFPVREATCTRVRVPGGRPKLESTDAAGAESYGATRNKSGGEGARP